MSDTPKDQDELTEEEAAKQAFSLIIEFDDDDGIISLDDGSIWQIAPSDIMTATVWLPTSRIEMRESEDEGYSHNLVNLSTRIII